MGKANKHTSIRLRDMNPTGALAYCANITSTEWSRLESGDTLDLWTVFRAYILNGYQDTDIRVPSRISDVWERCKDIIDREAGK